MKFVASAVAISMTPRIGPLITAIVVTGVRFGVCVEIGTMKVTEKSTRWKTMAIDPIHFL